MVKEFPSRALECRSSKRIVQDLREAKTCLGELVAHNRLHVVDVEAVDMRPEMSDLARGHIAVRREFDCLEGDVKSLIDHPACELMRFPRPCHGIAGTPV